jgi:hypothetical protein
MAELFIRMLLGHLVGDYLLQPKKMAIEKSAKGWPGWLWCLAHCILYTTTVCMFCWTAKPLVIFLVFLSHFPIDRWSLADHWLRFIGGRTLRAAYESTSVYREIEISFACLVYAVADNTMHFILLWMIIPAL